MKLYSITLGLILTSFVLSAQVPSIDTKTGYFKTTRKAVVIENIKIPKDSLKKLIVVPKGELIEGMTKNLNFFNEILTYEQLEREIVNNNLQEKVPTLEGYIGLSNAAKHYRPFYFLWVKILSKENKNYAQLILLDAISGKDVFISELKLQSYGYLTKNTYSPLFNTFIDYINGLK